MIIMYFNLEVYKIVYDLPENIRNGILGSPIRKLFRIIIDTFHLILRFYGTKPSKCLRNITKRTSVITLQMFNVI